MAHCPHCGEEMDVPAGELIKSNEFFDEEVVEDVSMSAQQHMQLTCRNCDAVLGYLAVGAATGG